jgi:flagellar hook-length control protein FliK
VLEATTPPPDFAKVQTTAGDGNVTSTLAATGTSAPQSATGVRPGATALPPVIEPSTGQVSLERILDQVKIRLAPQRPEVTIVIDPPELGRLHLRLSMHKGALSATVTADDPRVTRAFEADLGRLVRTLDEAGIRVGSVEIRTELSQSHDQGRGGRNDTHQASQEDQHRDARSLNKAVRTAVAPPPSVAGMSRTIAKTRSTLDLVV